MVTPESPARNAVGVPRFDEVASTQYHDGSSGGLAGWYRGGDTLGNVRITGPF
jgi:hypothetical protein